MGNCWPKPIDNLPSTIIRPSSPVHNDGIIKGIKNRNHNNNSSNNNSQSPPQRVAINRDGDGDGGGGGKTIPSSGEIVTPNLKMFTLAELKSATRNFRPDTVLGEGGFGRVFKGWIDEKTFAPSKVGVGIPVAVKKSNPDSEQGLKEWQAEVKFLGKFSHPNLVKLLGYCWEDKQFLLVYEYMQKGSLASHLFTKGAAEPIPWDTRIKIAVGTARGVAFLHTTEKQVIYRDFKSANILLDGNFNAKLSDFGLAKLGPTDGNTHVTTKIVGTYGYAAPEYMATGHLYVKSDVYGFGVVLLEIITGLQVLDLNRPNGQINLVEWATPFLRNKKNLKKIMDPQLEDQYPSKAATQVAELILSCLDHDLKRRPNMEEVLETLEKISRIQMKPKESKPKPKQDHRIPLHNHHGNGGARGNGSRPRPRDSLYGASSY